MTITAALVKELRERTNAGMMECKKALVESGGDMEAAIEAMRKAGQAKAVKKASRSVAEGMIVVLSAPDAKKGIIVEVNCETDFVAREERFKNFAHSVAKLALAENIQSVEALQEKTDAARLELVAQLGENVSVRRFESKQVNEGVVGIYAHGDANGVRIGSLVVLQKGTADLARDIAMQVAAMNPEYIKASDIPSDRLEKERSILLAQTLEEGKPAEMAEKILIGKLNKFSAEVALLGQSFVKETSKTIESLLKENGAEVASFTRFAVGEGVEKKEDNFVEEVMAQVRGEG